MCSGVYRRIESSSPFTPPNKNIPNIPRYINHSHLHSSVTPTKCAPPTTSPPPPTPSAASPSPAPLPPLPTPSPSVPQPHASDLRSPTTSRPPPPPPSTTSSGFRPPARCSRSSRPTSSSQGSTTPTSPRRVASRSIQSGLFAFRRLTRLCRILACANSTTATSPPASISPSPPAAGPDSTRKTKIGASGRTVGSLSYRSLREEARRRNPARTCHGAQGCVENGTEVLDSSLPTSVYTLFFPFII